MDSEVQCSNGNHMEEYKVCWNFDQLQQLTLKHFATIGLKHSSFLGYRHHELTNKINKWIERIRKSEFLLKENLISIERNKLNEQLINFTKLVKIKRYYCDKKLFTRRDFQKRTVDALSLYHI